MAEKKTLSNGLRIVWEHMPGVRSCSIGIWVKNGSRYEPSAQSGISHFIEHMIFKGTETRSAKQIAIETDAIGGQMNAFTTKECTCYYLKTLDTHLKKGISILHDMFMHSRFADEDIALERGVVNEEIDMYEDSPEDVANEKIFEACFQNSPLGRPVLGYKETLAQMDTSTLHAYMKAYYRPQDTVIALAGSFEASDIDCIASLFGAMQGEGQNQFAPATYTKSTIVREKEIEQCHICIGFPGVSLHSPNRYAMQMLNGILGGGMASRLFQTVREENGLCYSIYSGNDSYQDTGFFSVYTALGKPMEEKAIHLIGKVIQDFTNLGPTKDEIERYQDQYRTNLYLGLENTSARMTHLGRSELFTGTILTAEELLARCLAVTYDNILETARQVFDFEHASICAVGQVDAPEQYQTYLTNII